MLFLVLLAIGVLLLNLLVQIGAVISSTEYFVSRNRRGMIGVGYLRDAWILGVMSIRLMFAHLIQISLWAGAFMLAGEFDLFRTAFYHSAVNFAALGYGDIVMSEDWRLLGALEACVGVMMFGISAAMLFGGISQLIKVRFGKAGPGKK